MKTWTDEECDRLYWRCFDGDPVPFRELIRAAVDEARREQLNADIDILMAGIPLRSKWCCKEAVAGIADILKNIGASARDKEPRDAER